MTTSINPTTPTRQRGEGMIYRGSITAQHGATVRWMDDCACLPCSALDPFDPARHVNAQLNTEAQLIHARMTSFEAAPPQFGVTDEGAPQSDAADATNHYAGPFCGCRDYSCPANNDLQARCVIQD